MRYPQLQDKVVMVTGASEGLGAALSRKFIENGCYVYMGARNIVKLQALAEELGERAFPRFFDVREFGHHEIRSQEVYDKHQRLDIWVNNAGVDQKASLSELTSGMIEEITAVNYFGLVYGTQYAAEFMKKNKQGDIVQIISTSAFTPRTNESMYCAAKAAAKIFSESVALELKQDGIRVLPILPGWNEY